MKNVKRYIVDCSPYDLIMRVAPCLNVCPIVAFSHKIPEGYTIECSIPADCGECVQKWLGKEAE